MGDIQEGVGGLVGEQQELSPALAGVSFRHPPAVCKYSTWSGYFPWP